MRSRLARDGVALQPVLPGEIGDSIQVGERPRTVAGTPPRTFLTETIIMRGSHCSWSVSIAAFLLAGVLAAQGPTLAATGTTSPPAVTISVSGAAANAHVILAGSLQLGPGTMGGVTLGIAPPWILMDMGTTNASGALSLTVNILPGSIPPPLSGTMAYVQGGVVSMSGTMGTGGMGSGGMGSGGMGSGGMSGPGSGSTINCGGGMIVTLTNVATFVFP